MPLEKGPIEDLLDTNKDKKLSIEDFDSIDREAMCSYLSTEISHQKEDFFRIFIEQLKSFPAPQDQQQADKFVKLEETIGSLALSVIGEKKPKKEKIGKMLSLLYRMDAKNMNIPLLQNEVKSLFGVEVIFHKSEKKLPEHIVALGKGIQKRGEELAKIEETKNQERAKINPMLAISYEKLSPVDQKKFGEKSEMIEMVSELYTDYLLAHKTDLGLKMGPEIIKNSLANLKKEKSNPKTTLNNIISQALNIFGTIPKNQEKNPNTQQYLADIRNIIEGKKSGDRMDLFTLVRKIDKGDSLLGNTETSGLMQEKVTEIILSDIEKLSGEKMKKFNELTKKDFASMTESEIKKVFADFEGGLFREKVSDVGKGMLLRYGATGQDIDKQETQYFAKPMQEIFLKYQKMRDHNSADYKNFFNEIKKTYPGEDPKVVEVMTDEIIKMQQNIEIGATTRKLFFDKVFDSEELSSLDPELKKAIEMYKDMQGKGLWNFSDKTTDELKNFVKELPITVVSLLLSGGIATVTKKVLMDTIMKKIALGGVSKFMIGGAIEGAVFHGMSGTFGTLLTGDHKRFESVFHGEGYLDSIKFMYGMGVFGNLSAPLLNSLTGKLNSSISKEIAKGVFESAGIVMTDVVIGKEMTGVGVLNTILTVGALKASHKVVDIISVNGKGEIGAKVDGQVMNIIPEIQGNHIILKSPQTGEILGKYQIENSRIIPEKVSVSSPGQRNSAGEINRPILNLKNIQTGPRNPAGEIIKPTTQKDAKKPSEIQRDATGKDLSKEKNLRKVEDERNDNGEAVIGEVETKKSFVEELGEKNISSLNSMGITSEMLKNGEVKVLSADPSNGIVLGYNEKIIKLHYSDLVEKKLPQLQKEAEIQEKYVQVIEEMNQEYGLQLIVPKVMSIPTPELPIFVMEKLNAKNFNDAERSFFEQPEGFLTQMMMTVATQRTGMFNKDVADIQNFMKSENGIVRIDFGKFDPLDAIKGPPPKLAAMSDSLFLNYLIKKGGVENIKNIISQIQDVRQLALVQEAITVTKQLNTDKFTTIDNKGLDELSAFLSNKKLSQGGQSNPVEKVFTEIKNNVEKNNLEYPLTAKEKSVRKETLELLGNILQKNPKLFEGYSEATIKKVFDKMLGSQKRQLDMLMSSDHRNKYLGELLQDYKNLPTGDPLRGKIEESIIKDFSNLLERIELKIQSPQEIETIVKKAKETIIKDKKLAGVQLNAEIGSMPERFLVAEELLGMKLSPEQKNALELAHNVRGGQGTKGIDNYRNADLGLKLQILSGEKIRDGKNFVDNPNYDKNKPLFEKDQRKKLLETGVCGFFDFLLLLGGDQSYLLLEQEQKIMNDLLEEQAKPQHKPSHEIDDLKPFQEERVEPLLEIGFNIGDDVRIPRSGGGTSVARITNIDQNRVKVSRRENDKDLTKTLDIDKVRGVKVEDLVIPIEPLQEEIPELVPFEMSPQTGDIFEKEQIGSDKIFYNGMNIWIKRSDGSIQNATIKSIEGDKVSVRWGESPIFKKEVSISQLKELNELVMLSEKEPDRITTRISSDLQVGDEIISKSGNHRVIKGIKENNYGKEFIVDLITVDGVTKEESVLGFDAKKIQVIRRKTWNLKVDIEGKKLDNQEKKALDLVVGDVRTAISKNNYIKAATIIDTNCQIKEQRYYVAEQLLKGISGFDFLLSKEQKSAIDKAHGIGSGQGKKGIGNYTNQDLLDKMNELNRVFDNDQTKMLLMSGICGSKAMIKTTEKPAITETEFLKIKDQSFENLSDFRNQEIIQKLDKMKVYEIEKLIIENPDFAEIKKEMMAFRNIPKYREIMRMHDLSLLEGFSIYYYTSNNYRKVAGKYERTDYTPVNSVFRDNFYQLMSRERKGENLLKNYLLGKVATEAVKKMPKNQGVEDSRGDVRQNVFRGLNFTNQKDLTTFLQQFTIGDVFVEKGFASTTTDITLAKKTFAKEGIEIGSRANPVMLNIENGSGFVINDISLFDNVGEVIFPPGSKFQVMKVNQSTNRVSITLKYIP